MMVSSRGKLIRIQIGEIRETGRNAMGVRLMNIEAGEKVVAVENLPESEVAVEGGNGSAEGSSEGETAH